MSRKGSIFIVDDDHEDQEMIERIVKTVTPQNPVRKFSNAHELISHLRNTTESPLLILCDINMPLINGLELKATLNTDPDLHAKHIPFVFLTTSANKAQVSEAYELNAHGFMVKGINLTMLEDTIGRVIHYWQACVHPGDF